MQISTKKLTIAAVLFLSQLSFGQQEEELLYSNRISVLAGLIQPFVLKGGNIEVTYFSKKMSFDYSHGFSLDISGETITGDAKTQKLAYHLPFSTGFGIGYRISSYFDVRIEPKMHSWEVYYDGETQNKSNVIKKYKTYTLGLGAYYRYMPFRTKEGWVKGITTSTSLRCCPNVASSLKNDEFSYYNKLTNKNETLKASNIGIAGSQFLVNLSIGYIFLGKK